MADWNPAANEIFLTALEVNDLEQCRIYLDSACAGDAGLRPQRSLFLEKNDSHMVRPGSHGVFLFREARE